MKLTDNNDDREICLSGQVRSVFLDRDGGLFDINLDPEVLAIPKRPVPGLLEIWTRSGGALAVVSGRESEANHLCELQ